MSISQLDVIGVGLKGAPPLFQYDARICARAAHFPCKRGHADLFGLRGQYSRTPCRSFIGREVWLKAHAARYERITAFACEPG